MLLVVGLAAGLLGGLLGIGGSVIMIPAMAALFHGQPWDDQHLFQASAMIVNVIVSLPAASRHRRSGTVPRQVVRILMPVTTLCIVLGVVLSNMLDAGALRRIFAAFLVYIALWSLYKALRRHPDHEDHQVSAGAKKVGAIGFITGTTGGLLGIGGGVLSVPMLQAWCKLPLRRAIAASASVMIISAAVGAVLKVFTLHQHDQRWTSALLIAACLAPSGLVGGRLGAELTHRAPIGVIRIVFAVMVLAMASRMLGMW